MNFSKSKRFESLPLAYYYLFRGNCNPWVLCPPPTPYLNTQQEKKKPFFRDCTVNPQDIDKFLGEAIWVPFIKKKRVSLSTDRNEGDKKRDIF